MTKKSKAALKLEASAKKAFDNNPYDGMTLGGQKPMPSLRDYPAKPLRTNPADANGPRPADFNPLDKSGLPGNKY